MKHAYENGAIVASGKYYEEAVYHVSNRKISVIFDGKGAVRYYAKSNSEPYLNGRGTANIHIDGEHIDMFADKTVEMIGRRQTVTVKTRVGKLTVDQFVDQTHNGIYLFYSLIPSVKDCALEVGVCIGNIQELNVVSDCNVDKVQENAQFIICLTAEKSAAKLFVTFDKNEIDAQSSDLSSALQRCNDEINSVRIPENLNEMQKTMYLSCYFCALQNYKEAGDFKAFSAGYRYLSPLRTYYRDSYYTVLPMYNGQTDKIKNQILTLARGIAFDGSCPSAVKADFSAFWGDHYDSPSFYVIMLYDYVRYTGDRSLLKENVGGVTVLDKAVAVMEKLSDREAENGLLWKDGKYNKRDWADEVNRCGFVTYDEILYARALYSLGKMYSIIGDVMAAERFLKKFERVKAAINEELWDEERGYYVNFKNDEYIEDNLSVDTVLAVIFGVADGEKAKRMLVNMERILETTSNPYFNEFDYGVACVYPFYKRPQSAYWKSAQPFNYHNGSNWPYLSAMYAYAKKQYGMNYSYPLESWFFYNVQKGNYTPIEYFSPACADGSLLQAWSGVAAFVFDEKINDGFFGD